MITINDLAKLMGKTREEVEVILKTNDVIELDLTKDDEMLESKNYRMIKQIKW